MFGLNIKLKHDSDYLFIRLREIIKYMKNLISSFSIINFKKNFNKNFKINNSVVNEKPVHFRRDLDSLG